MPHNLTEDLPNIMKNRNRKTTQPEKDVMMNDPRWEDSEEAREMVKYGLLFGMAEFENLFPQDYGKALHPEGNWIQVQKPPHCEITVPPFSIWFAVPWPMDSYTCGVKVKRVKIVTLSGTLGLMPNEYSVIQDMGEWLGREPEGVMLRQMNDKPVCDADHLFYLMSRGITRKAATLMLIHTIKDPTFLWMEIAPQYGEYFGREWPDAKHCPFALPRDQWIPESESELLTKRR